MGKGRAFNARDETVRRGRRSDGNGVFVEFKATGAERRWMETEDTGGANSAIDAANDDVVKKPTFFDTAVAAFAFDEGEGVERGWSG